MATHSSFLAMDRRTWQAIVHRVTKSWTLLKWLSMHSCTRDSSYQKVVSFSKELSKSRGQIFLFFLIAEQTISKNQQMSVLSQMESVKIYIHRCLSNNKQCLWASGPYILVLTTWAIQGFCWWVQAWETLPPRGSGNLSGAPLPSQMSPMLFPTTSFNLSWSDW